MADKNTCCGGVRLVFPCSGAADVGGIADQVGRKTTMEGLGRMYCLAGIGGHVEGILETTKQAEAVLAVLSPAPQKLWSTLDLSQGP